VDARRLLPLLSRLPEPEEVLPGRPEPIGDPGSHFVSGRRLAPPYPAGTEIAMFAMGCFWGAEQRFWLIPGVWITAAGHAGGATPNPTYEEIGTGLTGHVEVVRVVYDPAVVPYETLLKVFWENRDPTQVFRQGRDVGNWYRSIVFASTETAVEARPPFYFAEAYHQQYLAKNPDGDCGLGGTGIACPIGRSRPRA